MPVVGILLLTLPFIILMAGICIYHILEMIFKHKQIMANIKYGKKEKS